MQILETFRSSVSSLRANILRSALTMLGIVIGVSAVIAMAALGNGAEASVQERIAKLGTTLLQISASRISQQGVAVENPVRLTAQDADLLRLHQSVSAMGATFSLVLYGRDPRGMEAAARAVHRLSRRGSEPFWTLRAGQAPPDGAGGTLFGWIYWRSGLPYAIAAHFAADMVVQTMGPRVLG